MQEEERKADSGLSEEGARAEALKTTQGKDKRKSFCCCFAWIIALLVLTVFLFFCVLSLLGSRRGAWQSRAKGTLRSIGTAELAYQQANKAKVYGSFQALQDTLHSAEGYNLGNMVENYTFTWEVHDISTVPTEKFPSGIISTFTVIAYPRDTRPGFLNTFGITDDQVVRVFAPQNGNRFEDVKTWDPIL
jgi:hypothetical protein